MRRYMLLGQQVHNIKPIGLTNSLGTHKLISDDPVEGVWNNHEFTLI